MSSIQAVYQPEYHHYYDSDFTAGYPNLLLTIDLIFAYVYYDKSYL